MISRSRSFVVLFVAVAACNSGGGGSQTPGAGTPGDIQIKGINRENPGGVWTGALVSNVSPGVVDILALISEAGDIRIIASNGSQLFGSLSAAGSTASGALTGVTALGLAWLDGSTSAAFSVDGAVSERDTFSGTYAGGGEAGTFSLSYDPVYERNSSLANVDGMWVVFDELSNIFATLAIDGEGTINGSDADGCVYSGSVTIPDSRFNIYDIAMSVANCLGDSAILNRDFAGEAFLSDVESDSGANDLLTIAVNGMDVVITLELTKL